ITLSLPPEAFDLSGAERLRPIVELAGSAGLFAFGLGVVMLAGEFRHGTIRQTLLVTPARGRVLAAKLLAAVPVGIAFAVAAVATSLVVGVPWLLLDGIEVNLADRELLLDVLGNAAAVALSVPLGVALAAVLRMQSLTVVAYVLWTLFAESAVDFVFSEATPYLIGEALLALGRSGALAVDPLPMWGAALVVAGYIAVLALLGQRVTLRRDVP
ncbi:MAG TPA: hypothetical protein VD813_13540, partial [Pseudonocardia sp.]|nr:hypothetical protein [Pseudonocardia sp.]